MSNLKDYQKSIEKPEDVYNSLCAYDKRNPYFEDFSEYAEQPKPRNENCSCDNCFYGRDELAVKIIELYAEINQLKEATQ